MHRTEPVGVRGSAVNDSADGGQAYFGDTFEFILYFFIAAASDDTKIITKAACTFVLPGQDDSDQLPDAVVYLRIYLLRFRSRLPGKGQSFAGAAADIGHLHSAGGFQLPLVEAV